ncbi:uncharacterized protein JCM10292_003763 [Rhodotorula paludigena]|uniref:uncharacterized protein n=1 Tax=Rhodotorula paludigena TaxID=86838 RepID=UPI003174B96B
MPLDASLYVLHVRPREGVPGCVDFLEDNTAIGAPGEPIYTAYKDPAADVITLVDSLSHATLGTHTIAAPPVPNASSNPKHRLVALESPRLDVSLRNPGSFSWTWEMEWEETKFVWSREAHSLIGAERGYTLSVSRRPDPNFPVVVYAPRKKGGGSIQVFDYNLDRVEPRLRDRKGFEIAALLALCYFIEPLFAVSNPTTPISNASPAVAASAAATPSPPLSRITSLLRPTPPPEPPQPPRAPPPQRKKSSLASLAVNEIAVTDASPAALDGYRDRCLKLLEDRALLYLLLVASSHSTVPAVASLAERVKRERYKVSGEEVRLFVDDDGAEAGESASGKGKKRQSFAAPPTTLKIYLSRIDMGELLPNHRSSLPARPPKPPIRPPINFDEPAPPSGATGGRTRHPPPRPERPPAQGGGKLKRHPSEGQGAETAAQEEPEGGAGWKSWLLGGGK